MACLCKSRMEPLPLALQRHCMHERAHNACSLLTPKMTAPWTSPEIRKGDCWLMVPQQICLISQYTSPLVTRILPPPWLPRIKWPVWKPAETLTETSIVGAFQDATRVHDRTVQKYSSYEHAVFFLHYSVRAQTDILHKNGNSTFPTGGMARRQKFWLVCW